MNKKLLFSAIFAVFGAVFATESSAMIIVEERVVVRPVIVRRPVYVVEHYNPFLDVWVDFGRPRHHWHHWHYWR